MVVSVEDIPENVQRELSPIEDMLMLYCIAFSVVYLLNTNSDALIICLLISMVFSGMVYYRLKKSKLAMRGVKTIFIFVFSFLSTVSDNVANYVHKALSTFSHLVYLMLNPAEGMKPATGTIEPIKLEGVNLYLFETVAVVGLLYTLYYLTRYALTIEDNIEPMGFINWLKAN